VCGHDEIVVVGTTVGSLVGPHVGSGDVFARKYDRLGNELWTRQLGTAYIECGAFPGQVKGDGESDTFVRKYDGAGSELWTQQVGSSGSNNGAAVCTDTNGHIFVAGSTFTSLANYDGFVIRLNE
jgi:hypothetical protein